MKVNKMFYCQAFTCVIPGAMTAFKNLLMKDSEILDVPLVGVVHRCDGKVVSVTVVSGIER